MTTAFAPTAAKPVLANAPHRVGRVALIVHDLDRVSAFYQSVLGLRALSREPDATRLGTDSAVLIELRQDADARVQPRHEAGLFHTAFLLPRRADLGSWLDFALTEGVKLTGASDHFVSEAVYLNDPEGNGIEIYVDRPSSQWRRTDGLIRMTTDPLDIDGLLGSAGPSWSGFPDNGVVGHVHLQVGDLGAADGFYRDLLGFEVTSRYPGANFYGSGGYHHQLAGNIWNSEFAAPRADRATGLADVELLFRQTVVDAVLARMGRGGREEARNVTLRDLWGISITLRSA